VTRCWGESGYDKPSNVLANYEAENGYEGTLTVRVWLRQPAIDADVTGTFTVTLTASPTAETYIS